MRALIRTVLVAGIGVALVLGAYRLPDLRYHLAGSAGSGPSAGGSVLPVTRPLTRSSLICPGPETVGVKGVDTAKAAAPTIVRVAAPPTDLLDALESGANAPATGASAGSVAASPIGGTGPLAFPPFTAPGANGTQTDLARSILLSGKGSLAPGLVAAQTTLVTTGDQRGLSTSACAAPAADTWLVGGGGEPGRRGRVVLTNPSPNGVTVDLDVYGAKGPVRATAARGIVVGAHERTVVLLDAIAPGERSPVIHVVASGGLISAALNDTWLDGTTPVGADDVVGTAPGNHLVVPGVTASGAPGSLLLRIGAPTRAAVVRVRLLGSQGPQAAPVNNGVIRVAAHRVKDVDLSAVAPGAYGIQLTCDQPVVAAAELRPPAATPAAPGATATPTATPPATARRDLSWSSAQPAITALAGLPLGFTTAPWTTSAVLTAPDADAQVDLVTVAADGTEKVQRVSVEAGTTTSVPLTAPAVSAWLRPRSGTISAAVLTTYGDPAGPMTSVAPLADARLRTTAVTVHPLGG